MRGHVAERIDSSETAFGRSTTSGEASARTLIGRRATFRGDEAFKLYDTFGLPLDFIEDAAGTGAFRSIETGSIAAMDEQRKRAQASWKGGAKATASPLYQSLPRTEFEGYHKTLSTGC